MSPPRLAFTFSGGGARAAYQVGVLRHLASRHPGLTPNILTGVSAGGIIATHLASRQGTFEENVEELVQLWAGLTIDDVFCVEATDLARHVLRWGIRLVSGGLPGAPGPRSLVDTAPLRAFLSTALAAAPDGTIPGVSRRLDAGTLEALAITASSYSTGQSVTWVQRRGADRVFTLERTQRRGVLCGISLDHVMASSALPLFFPAIEVDGGWYGDGGIRLTAPLSPAVHLGADRIVAVSTRYARSRKEAEAPAIRGYPPPAQVAGVLLNAIFLDRLDADAEQLERINQLLDRLPREQRGDLRHIDMLVLRPSRDLGLLANEYEANLPHALRFMVRGLGSRQTRSNDFLSLIMFQHDYLSRLIELGEADARDREGEIAAFLGPSVRVTADAPH